MSRMLKNEVGAPIGDNAPIIFQLSNNFLHEVNPPERGNHVKARHVISHRSRIFEGNVDRDGHCLFLINSPVLVYHVFPNANSPYAACKKPRVLLAHDRENAAV